MIEDHAPGLCLAAVFIVATVRCLRAGVVLAIDTAIRAVVRLAGA